MYSKVFLIALITLGSILFGLLMICIILACCMRKNRHFTSHIIGNRTIVNNSGIGDISGIVPNIINGHKLQISSSTKDIDQRAIIPDGNSEISDDSNSCSTLPYVTAATTTTPTSNRNRLNSITNNNNSNTMNDYQKDRSLTVMIPRAKYHSNVTIQKFSNDNNNYHDAGTNRRILSDAITLPSICSTTEAKLQSYLDASPLNGKVKQFYFRIYYI